MFSFFRKKETPTPLQITKMGDKTLIPLLGFEPFDYYSKSQPIGSFDEVKGYVDLIYNIPTGVPLLDGLFENIRFRVFSEDLNQNHNSQTQINITLQTRLNPSTELMRKFTNTLVHIFKDDDYFTDTDVYMITTNGLWRGRTFWINSDGEVDGMDSNFMIDISLDDEKPIEFDLTGYNHFLLKKPL